MSLTSAIGTALRGMNVTQDQMSNSANNIANVNTPGYISQRKNQATLVVDGQAQGAYIASNQASVDQQLLVEMQRTSASLEKNSRLETYLESAVNLYGAPDSTNSLSARVDQFFTSLQSLADSPQTASARLNAVTAANTLAEKIAYVADGLQSLRFDADKEISNSVNTINSILERLYNTNTSVGKYPEGTEGRVSIDRQRANDLRQLSEFLDVTSIEDSHGILSVLAAGGVSLLDNNRYILSYQSAASKSTFINNGSLGAVYVTPMDDQGNLITTARVELTSSGRSSTITSNIADGTLRGMLDLRDDIFPTLLEQLDTFADTFRDAANELHNEGTSFPPPTSLTGVKALANNTSIGFDGSIRIAVVNQDGTPVLSPYGDEQYYRPLTLDLSSLDSGDGAGEFTVQTLMDEINDYFGPPQNRASVGNLRDIRLASISDSISDAGTAQFDLELDNTSAQDSTVVIQSITVIDPNDLSTGYTAATLPSPNTYTVSSGNRERTNIPFTVDFSGDDNLASYTVRVRVQVTDADGTVSVADIDYEVSDNVTDNKNQRYAAAGATNVSGTSSFIEAPSSARFATASLVDADGDLVSDGIPGYLRITTADGQNYGIAIDSLDSEEVGTSTTATANITHRGFSYFFGMNDLFSRNNETTAGSAITLELRSDIASNANKLAVGKLTLSNAPVSSDQIPLTYELAIGNNENVQELATLASSTLSFSATDTFPASTSTLTSYIGDLTGYAATQKNNISSTKSILETDFQALQQSFQETAGVNTDEELGLIIQLQNQFGAMAQVIRMAREMLTTLSQILS